MLTINYDTHEVFLRRKPVKLTPIEYKIICQLLKHNAWFENLFRLAAKSINFHQIKTFFHQMGIEFVAANN